MQKQALIQAALALSLAAAAASPSLAADAKDPEKCYGINAAYKNDCQAPGHACAGHATKARDANSFVVVPAGLCAKIEGSSLKPMAS